MQATVRSYDPETGSGSLLLDDGTELTCTAAALDSGGLRLLRSGQRVFVVLTPAGAVQAVSIWT